METSVSVIAFIHCMFLTHRPTDLLFYSSQQFAALVLVASPSLT